MNVTATGTNGYANLGALTIASVETIAITTTTSATATTMFDLNMDAANATTITVSGVAGITFANGTHSNVITMDASGVTATGAAGVVTFAATTAQNATITGGAGNDALTGGAANDVISGGVGDDLLRGEGGNDTLSGGNGADTITGGLGQDTLTGGAGNDIFAFGVGDSLITGADTITDYAAGDVIRIADGNTADAVAGASAAGTTNATTDVAVSAGGKVTFAAADDTLAEMIVALGADDTDVAINEVVFFEFGGNTYIFSEGEVVGNGDDQLIVLSGITGMTTLTESLTTAGDYILA
jgi:S-layer protein